MGTNSTLSSIHGLSQVTAYPPQRSPSPPSLSTLSTSYRLTGDDIYTIIDLRCRTQRWTCMRRISLPLSRHTSVFSTNKQLPFTEQLQSTGTSTRRSSRKSDEDFNFPLSRTSLVSCPIRTFHFLPIGWLTDTWDFV